MSYKVVVLPDMLVIRRTTLDRLKQFKAAGGAILVLGMYPAYVDGNANPAAIDSLKNISRFVEENKLKEALDEVTPSLFALTGTDNELVWTHHRKVNDGGIIQMSNTSRLKPVDCELVFTPAVKNPALWNPENGTSMKLQPEKDGRITAAFRPGNILAGHLRGSFPGSRFGKYVPGTG